MHQIRCDGPECKTVWTKETPPLGPDMDALAGKDFCCWVCLIDFAIRKAQQLGEWPTDEEGR